MGELDDGAGGCTKVGLMLGQGLVQDARDPRGEPVTQRNQFRRVC